MSSSNTRVTLTLHLAGDARQSIQRLTQTQIDGARRAAEAMREQTRTIQQLDSHRRLGIRTEAQIRAEIAHTRQAYSQLHSTGRATTNELQRAHRAMTEQVRQLNRELGEADRRYRGLSAAGRGLGAAGGAVMGGMMAVKSVVSTPLERARSFETKMFDATTSITGGYQGLSLQQGQQQNLKLNQYAKAAVRQGHGSVDGIGDAAGILAGSGLYRAVDELKAPLLAIAKSSFASGAPEQDMANLTFQLRQFGISNERTQAALDRSAASGFSGGFELTNMARFLPDVLPYATKAGYSGDTGYNQVLTHMQLARKATGIPSEAADNMRDLYNLFNQRHFALSVGKFIKPLPGDPMTKIGLRGNKIGFDIATYLQREREKNVDTVTAVAKLMQRQFNQNSQYVRIQRELAEAKRRGDNTAVVEKYTALSNLVQGSELGRIFHNLQSLSGLMAIMQGTGNGEYDRIYNATANGEGAIDRVVKQKELIEPAKAHMLEQEAILATIRVYDQVKGTLGEFEGSLKKAMEANQGLTASAVAAAGALAVIAGAGAGGKLLGGMGAGGAAAAGAGAGATGATLGSRLLAANNRFIAWGSRGVATAGAGATAAAVTVAGAAGYGIGSTVNRRFIAPNADLSDRIGGTLHSIAAMLGSKDSKEVLDQHFSSLIAINEQAKDQQQRALAQSQQIIGQLQSLNNNISAIGNRPAPVVNVVQQMTKPGSLMDMVSEATGRQANRGGGGSSRIPWRDGLH